MVALGYDGMFGRQLDYNFEGQQLSAHRIPRPTYSAMMGDVDGVEGM